MIIEHLGKVVGILREDKTYISRRNEKHYFRKFQGFGISYSVIEKLLNMRCSKVIIIYEKNNKEEKYETSLFNFINYGETWKDLEGDFQKILPLSEFNQKKLKEVQYEN